MNNNAESKHKKFFEGNKFNILAYLLNKGFRNYTKTKYYKTAISNIKGLITDIGNVETEFLANEQYLFKNVDALGDMSKSLEKVMDLIYYTIKDNSLEEINISDLVTRAKTIIDFDYSEIIVIDYKVKMVLQYMCTEEEETAEYNSDQFIFVKITNMLIDLIKQMMFTENDRVVKGFNLATGKVKHLLEKTRVLDIAGICVNYRTQNTVNAISTIATQTSESVYGIKGTEINVKQINELNDDILRANLAVDIFNDMNMVTDLINQQEEALSYPLNSLDDNLIIPDSDNAQAVVGSRYFEQRKLITSSKGNLLLNLDESSSLESLLIKDTMLLDKYAFIMVVYRMRSGKEKSIAIPLGCSFVVNDETCTIFQMLGDFYQIEKNANLNYEVLSPYYWKYRNKKYRSLGDSLVKGKLDREYKATEIYIHKSKLGKPSDSAKTLAKKWHITLEEGETLVQTHIRHYGVKLEKCIGAN